VLDVSGRILDVKIAAGKPSPISPEHRFQIATCAQFMPGANGDARIDTLVKTKTPGFVTHRFTIADQDLRTVQSGANGDAVRALHAGRMSMNCSRRNCFFLTMLREECGREVLAGSRSAIRVTLPGSALCLV
jgi:hypothetical protein